MELQNAIVAHHLDELQAVADQLRVERRRRRSGPGRVARVRMALGRVLVAAGNALLDGAAPRATVPR